MYLSKLKLVNFRNYDKLEIILNKNMNIFVGNNAQGKTNILESIGFLALTKSFRAINESDLIKINKVKSIVNGRVKKDSSIKNLEIILEENKKNLSINKTQIRRVSDYISNLLVISFTPDDLKIIKDSPSVRRNILNIQISQLSKEYLNTYNEYNKLLKIRNEYLKILLTNSLADRSYFDVITDKLIEKAIVIYQMRNDYINQINKNISNIYNLISSSDSNLFIKYEPNVELDKFDTIYIKEKLINIYKNNYKRELNNGMTLFGPHRDDFSFYINNNNLKIFGSQGQQKLSIIAYKLAEINVFNDITNTKPVLLFDDIFSELDIKKRNQLLKYVNNNIQTIITTTDIKNINKKYVCDAYIFEVKNGIVERK